jgi:transposase
MYGLTIPRLALRDPSHRGQWLFKINQPVLARQLNMLWIGYDATAKQTRMAKQQLLQLSKIYPVIHLWEELPGIGLIRATTSFAYLDTPWRFKKKNALWKYCGVGLQRTTSGTDKKGRPKPARLQLPWAVNRKLKNMILGAAISAINQNDNVFKAYYERMVQDGVISSNARHAVARKMLTVMWGMWKTNSRFDERLCQESNRPTASALSR